MKKLGLALSGGGFRASLYHLGLLRFLRDAGLLSQVTHITSVSGGSIMAAHLEPAYADHPRAPLPVTERLTRHSLILPLFHTMTEAQQDRVVAALREQAGG